MNGILFKDEMVLPILNTKPDVWPAEPIDENGAFKWQTRRVIKHPEYMGCLTGDCPHVHLSHCESSIQEWAKSNARYKVGEILYVKEVFNDDGCACYEPCSCPRYWYRASEPNPSEVRWTSSLIMPAKAARLWVKVMNVRVERVEDINEADAMAEGCCIALRGHDDDFARSCYRELYDRINGFGSFERDWCFVYEFQRVSKP